MKPIEYNGDQDFTLEDLPTELLMTILSFLDQNDLLLMMCVSEKLRSLATDPSLWKRLRIYPDEKAPKYARLVVQHCPRLKELRFMRFIHCDAFLAIYPWITYSPIMGEYEFRRQQISRELLHVFGGCRFLQKLDFGNLKVDVGMTRFIVRAFPRLKELTITDSSVTIHGLIELTKLNFLEKLDLFDSKTWNQRGGGSLRIIAENFENLEELGLHVANTEEESSSDLINIINSHKNKLKKLYFDGLKVTVDDSTCELLSGCKLLEELAFRSGINVTDFGLTFLQKLQNLRILEIKNLLRVSSEELLKFLNETASLPKLETLKLTDSHLCDAGMNAIARKCPNLRRLDVGMYKDLTQGGIIPILENFKLLTGLGLESRDIPDERLLEIPFELPELRILVLWRAKVQDHTLASLKEIAPHLEVIKLPNYGN